MKHNALIFDLDGVLVDTAKYHYLAWKSLADTLNIPFTLQDNERLKGVSRRRSLEIILEIGGVAKSEAEQEALCAEKNELYLTYIRRMGAEEVFPGVREFLLDARERGYRIALGSASKNAPLILERLELTGLFDAIVDGNMVSRAKPDPEVFALGGKLLGAAPKACIVFEDSVAGIQAAHIAGMAAVGIGAPEALPEADLHLPGLDGVKIDAVERGLP
ncbi:MAG: beta-phosphoglucomutase [Oscillospiraceae bacterium]|nr:beta-phosphoglucomutase [Oscillospiraceae bacterium]